MPKKRKAPRRQNRYQNAYRKQRRRIQNTLSRYRRQGYDVQFVLPAIPKTITAASVRRLESITPKDIQRKTFDVDVLTGEQLTYTRSRRTSTSLSTVTRAQLKATKQSTPAPSQAAPSSAPMPEIEIPLLSDIILANFRLHISYYPDSAKAIVLEWLNTMLASHTESEVAKAVQSGRESGAWLEPREVYSTENLYAALAEMSSFMGLSAEETTSLLDDIDEEYEDWEGF